MKTKPDIKNRFVIIMAGGRGERFWPLSREKMPKQLLALLGKKSFLQEAVERVLPIVPAKNIFVITNEAQLPEVRNSSPKSRKRIWWPSRWAATPAPPSRSARRWSARVRRPV